MEQVRDWSAIIVLAGILGATLVAMLVEAFREIRSEDHYGE